MSRKIRAIDTKYLYFDHNMKRVKVTQTDFTVYVDENSTIQIPYMCGYSGWRLFKSGCYDVPINSATARQLQRYLKEVSRDTHYDYLKVNWDKITEN